MSIPSYWATKPYKVDSAQYADGDTLIAAIETFLGTTLDVADRWEQISPRHWESKPDANGDRLYLVLSNPGGNGAHYILLGYGLNRVLNSNPGGPGAYFAFTETGGSPASNIIMLGGKWHFAMVGDTSGTYENTLITMIHPTPEAATAHSRKCLYRVQRDQFGNHFWPPSTPLAYTFLQDSDGYNIRSRAVNFLSFWSGNSNSDKMQTLGGKKLRCYMDIAWINSSTGWPYSVGAANQMIVCDRDDNVMSLVTMPIDDGVKGYFLVLPFSQSWGRNFAMRVPDP